MILVQTIPKLYFKGYLFRLPEEIQNIVDLLRIDKCEKQTVRNRKSALKAFAKYISMLINNQRLAECTHCQRFIHEPPHRRTGYIQFFGPSANESWQYKNYELKNIF